MANAATPPLRKSLGVISRPAINKITTAAISPTCRTVSSRTTSGSPFIKGREPKAKGPTIIPAKKAHLRLLEVLFCGITPPLTWQQRAVFLAISSHGEKLTLLP
jgi:hypothetical protein